MLENSEILLSYEALDNNIRFLRTLLGDKPEFCSVVKGNAYGHGIREFVPMATALGIKRFAVFSAREGHEVKQVAPEAALIVMGAMDSDALEWAITNEVEFFVLDQDKLDAAIQTAKAVGKKARVHLELETGMNRTGLPEESLPEIMKRMKENAGHLEFSGLCTHFAGAENISNQHRILDQLNRYEEAYKTFVANGLKPHFRHTACSAATIMYPETRMEMVRIGILQYGLWPSPETFLKFMSESRQRMDPLKRVITWRSRVMTIKRISSGEFVGYGTSFIAHENMKIAVVPVGYAQGYSRSLSNQGHVLIRGRLCMVVGIVNMNMLIADVSDLEEVSANDEVVLIGHQGDRSISVASFSEFSRKLNYEMLTRLSEAIPRRCVLPG